MTKTLVSESSEAAYEKDGMIYSAYQRNEVVSFYEDENGNTSIEVRKITPEEAKARRKAHEEFEKYAIEQGWLEIDRIGRRIWKKH